MLFYEEFRRIIENRLKGRQSLQKIVSKLKEKSTNIEGKIAFYPSGRLSAEILKEVNLEFNYLCSPVGTGCTASGLISSISQNQFFIGLKNLG